MNLGPHAGFIIAAYAVSAVVVAALTVWIIVDHHAQSRILADLEARGVKRRSAAAAGREAP
jgi:heme exporter protein D